MKTTAQLLLGCILLIGCKENSKPTSSMDQAISEAAHTVPIDGIKDGCQNHSN